MRREGVQGSGFRYLVHNNGRVRGEEGVKHGLAEEDAIRHELDAGLVAHHLTLKHFSTFSAPVYILCKATRYRGLLGNS